MKELVLVLLGRTLPKRLLKKWSKEPIGSFKYDVADYAPVSREVM